MFSFAIIKTVQNAFSLGSSIMGVSKLILLMSISTKGRLELVVSPFRVPSTGYSFPNLIDWMRWDE
jgi:hypothetical protein